MKRQSNAAFTLIEVLVVIAIIAILAGFVFPALQKGVLTAKRNAAVSEARAIAGAITLFYNDYGWMPVLPTEQGFTPGPGNGDYGQEQVQPLTEARSREIIQVLMASAEDSILDKINPKRRVYLDLDKASVDGELLDPWDQQYLIKLDVDYNNKIQFFSGTKQYNTRAIVVSKGPNRQLGSGSNEDASDNVANVILDLRNEN